MKNHAFNRNITAAIACLTLAGASAVKANTLTDAFASRPFASGASASFTGNNTTALTEVGEPDHDAVRNRSVWGAWIAPDNGDVTITTEGSSFDTVLAVYAGTEFGNLLPVARNNNVQSGFKWSKVHFPVKAGVAYSFAVDGAPIGSAGSGDAVVNVSFTSVAQPGAEIGTDSFAARPSLPSELRAIGIADTRHAFDEVDEPDHIGASKRTAWWRWVAPSNGEVTIDSLASDFDTAITVYVGDTLPTLSEVAINNDAPNVKQSRTTFQTLAGQEYQIRVEGYPINTAGNVILNLRHQPNAEPGAVAGSDAFINRGLLHGSRARGVANNRFFGTELDEPNHGSYGKKTTWWQWTAPANGVVTIRTEGSDVDTFIAVYTGSKMDGLTRKTYNNDALNVRWSEVQFDAKRGEPYQIMVDGFPFQNSGNIALLVNQGQNPNPGKPDAGAYYGLIHSSPASRSGAGFARVTLGSNSRFTLAAKIGSDSLSLTGQLSDLGTASSATKNGYSVALKYDDVARQFNGTVKRGGIEIGTFTAELPAYSRTDPALAPLTGRHSLFLVPDSSDSDLPQLSGRGTFSVGASGIVKFAGVLGNGRKVSQSAPLLAGDTWPLYVRTKKATDIILGSVAIDSMWEGDDFTGRLTWYGPSFEGNLDMVDAR